MVAKSVSIFWHWFKIAFLCTIIIWILRAFILVPMQVSGNSMSPNLQENDFIIMENMTKINRFDVIIFYAPDGHTYVKRVIGLPGDHIRYEQDQLYVNGEKVEEPFLESIKKEKNEYAITTDFELESLIGYKKVPKGQYFVLGDNRRVSKDSRLFGTISEQTIMGKARMVYYPISNMKFKLNE